MKLELSWSEMGKDGRALPVFDCDRGGTVITATPRGMKRVKCRDVRYVVKSYPMSHQMLKAVGDAAEAARQEGIYYSVLLTDAWKNTIGFAAFKANV